MEKGKYFLFFDEIQKVTGWEEQMKRIYDTYPSLKLILSGSESLFIRKRSRENLAHDLGISRQTVSHYLSGKILFGADNL